MTRPEIADHTPAEIRPLTPELLNTTNADLAKITKKAAVALAAANSLPATGTRVEIIDRLHAAKAGGRRGYKPAETLCPKCGYRTEVYKTKKSEPRDDGSRTVIRYTKCRGPRRHKDKYPVVER